jgi:hypothetical protein
MKDIWITMTINSLNYDTIEDLTDEWIGKVNKIGFQFHTPFVKNDPLWLQPICEQCGLGCYSVLAAQGIRGGNG